MVNRNNALIEDKEIENINAEIRNCQDKLKRMQKKIPWGILGGIIFSFLFPFIPGLRGRRPMIENWEYQNAVLFCAIIYIIIYPIGYTKGKNKAEKKLRELKLKKYLIEKER